MNAYDPKEDAQTVRDALANQNHPWRGGIDVFVGAYDIADEKTRAFMRAIAPYMFDGETLLRPIQGR